jgi:AraC family transcriptional regulator of adaptative response/methylated-DNA-[protein]-cysteine methyltransferase
MPTTSRDLREPIFYATGACALGAILVARSGAGLCALLLGDDPEPLSRDLSARFPEARLLPPDPATSALLARAIALVESPQPSAELTLDARGTRFQQRVWAALRSIPPGETASYQQIAARIGAPTAVRAVAQACAANPVAVLIPCHRVVRSDGSLSGYRWGIERKRALLDLEERVPAEAGTASR